MGKIVEAVTPQQIEQVRSLLREYRAELPLQLYFDQFEQELCDLPGAYRRPKGSLLLATVAGQPVGCIGLRPFPSENTCEMKRLFVRPAFRGMNLGRALVDRILEEARALGYHRLRLDTHPPLMAAAVHLYCELGFSEIPADPLPPLPGLHYMEIDLAPAADRRAGAR